MYLATININGFEYDANVEYTYIDACKGSRNEYGAPVEPDESASIEINSIKLMDGDTAYSIDLPESVKEGIEDEIMEEINAS